MKKIYLIAGVLAIITGLIVFNFANSLEKKAMQEYRDVVVASTVIPARTTITEDMIEIRSIPASAISANTFSDEALAVGKISDGVIEMGEIISASKIHALEDKGNNMGYFIPDNMRAITISVDAISGVGGFIVPGDRVDIISQMALEVDGNIDQETSQTISAAHVIAQDIEVLASGIITKAEPNVKNLTYNNLTLAVTPKQALDISFAASSGSIRFILRSVADNEQFDYGIVYSDNFLDER